MNVTIKQIRKKDFAAVRKFIIDGMHLTWYVDNKFELYFYSKYALYSELTKSTITLGAYLDDRLVGFLFARFKGDKVRFPSSYYRNFVRIIDTGIKALGKGELAGTYEQANQEMYEAFKKNDPDGEITFFAVDPTLTGQRIGTRLLDELTKRYPGKLVYLYTDTGSTYQFYERRGFKKAGEKTIQMTTKKEIFPLTCYLFSKRL